MKLNLDKKNVFINYPIWILDFQPYLRTYQAQRNRSDQQCSDFIFLQWCYSVRFNSCKKKKKKKIEKIPMSFSVVRNSVIFDLLVSQENVGVLQSKLKKLLTHLIKLKLFQPQFCLKSGFSINSLLSKVNIYEQFLVCKKL